MWMSATDLPIKVDASFNVQCMQQLQESWINQCYISTFETTNSLLLLPLFLHLNTAAMQQWWVSQLLVTQHWAWLYFSRGLFALDTLADDSLSFLGVVQISAAPDGAALLGRGTELVSFILWILFAHLKLTFFLFFLFFSLEMSYN